MHSLWTIFQFLHGLLQGRIIDLLYKQLNLVSATTSMRYIMKGGVWKNSEDQILKAAIMKYGLNQWSRISSLLQRKSAKQCKQRWYEWLDPSIKKTQWSRAEDQKLLQLARVFPSQWRTIAPFVGRTPMQCFERYQKLLDMAQGKSAQQSQELKKLRPGQIDPNPETKPARLDPIDMDEDEKEMLAEVRVRLANTKGKKAKRKERQKIIEEARRLAQLQKIRELQMAGVDNLPTQKQIKRMKQKQDINYNDIIPFKRDVPEFVYKLEQNETSKNSFFASTISLQTLEGKRRDVEEELQRKLDKKRLKKLKDRDYKGLVDLKKNFNMPAAEPINLPEPQLNQKDLEDMKKYNITTPLNSLMMGSSGNTPYGMTPQDKIMLSARVNYSLNHRQMTPAVQQQQEYPRQQMMREQQEFDGIDQLNYLKNIEKDQKDPSKKMRSVDRIISERIKTPSVNQWEQDRGKIKNLFKNLRKPENAIEFQIPEEENEDSQPNESQEERVIDFEQREKMELQAEQKLNQEKLRLISSAIKQNLPRPTRIPNQLKSLSTTESNADIIEKMINDQILSMLFNDSLEHPLSYCQLPQNNKIKAFKQIPYEKLEQARSLIQEQLSTIQVNYDSLINKHNILPNNYIYNSTTKQTQFSSKEVPRQKIRERQVEKAAIVLPIYVKLQILQKQEHMYVQKLQKRVKKHLKGYDTLITKKIDEVNELQKVLEELEMSKQALEQLEGHEQNIMGQRLNQLQKFYKLVYDSI